MNITLPVDLARYLRTQVELGRYASASDVIREALRRMAAQESSVSMRRDGPRRTLAGGVVDPQRVDEAIRRITEIRKQHTLGDHSIEDLINDRCDP